MSENMVVQMVKKNEGKKWWKEELREHQRVFGPFGGIILFAEIILSILCPLSFCVLVIVTMVLMGAPAISWGALESFIVRWTLMVSVLSLLSLYVLWLLPKKVESLRREFREISWKARLNPVFLAKSSFSKIRGDWFRLAKRIAVLSAIVILFLDAIFSAKQIVYLYISYWMVFLSLDVAYCIRYRNVVSEAEDKDNWISAELQPLFGDAGGAHIGAFMYTGWFIFAFTTAMLFMGVLIFVFSGVSAFTAEMGAILRIAILSLTVGYSLLILPSIKKRLWGKGEGRWFWLTRALASLVFLTVFFLSFVIRTYDGYAYLSMVYLGGVLVIVRIYTKSRFGKKLLFLKKKWKVG